MIITEIFPICDFCHEPYHDAKEKSVAALKRAMHRGGWKRVDGKDMCWICVEHGVTSFRDKAAIQRSRLS